MRSLKLLSAASLSLLFFNCASILNSKNQTVYLEGNASKAKVFVNNKEIGNGSTIKTKLPRNAQYQQIRIEEEGYKDEYLVVAQNHKSPLYIMSWIPFGILIYPPFLDMGNKSFDYKKHISLSAKKTKIQNRTDEQKYVVLENAAFDVKKEDVKYKVISKRNFKKNKEKFTHVETADDDLTFDNTIFSNSLNKILKKYNYIDTTNVLLKNNTKYLHINSKVKKVDFQKIMDKLGAFYLASYVTKTEIEWEILDVYEQPLFKKTINSTSGEFCNNNTTEKGKSKDVYISTVEDAITKSLFDFLALKEVKELIKATEEKEQAKEPMITLKKPEAITAVEDALTATVTIKNSKGHGSGCIISNDGYIITNFHVVATEKKALTIIDRFGKEYTGKLIRKNEKNDLALIKVDAVFPKAFTIPSTKNYNIGDDIFVIGTPKSLELGQSLSKGIISGVRTSQGVNYLQTDASVNGGNSGGSIVSKTGTLVGVVNSKVFGTGVEGLGFGSPAEVITSSLQVVQ